MLIDLSKKSHDQLSRLTCDVILENWRNEKKGWTNNFVCSDTSYVGCNTNFPSVDRSFWSPRNLTRVAIEYKPYRNRKEEVVKGLGQSLIYLNKNNNSASFLVCPDITSDSFEMGNYLETFFNDNIKGRLPVGLITFDPHDPRKIKLRCNIDKTLFKNAQQKAPTKEESYWAAFRDWPPLSYYYLLKCSQSITNNTNRKDKIWLKYWNDYYLSSDDKNKSEKIKNSLDLIPNKIKGFDNKLMIPVKGKKEIFKKQIINKIISHAQGINKLKLSISTKGVKENLFQNYKKNHFNFMNHCNLWDSENFNISAIGEMYISNIEKGNDPIEEMAKITLVKGRHLEIINDIIDITMYLPSDKKLNDSIYRESLENNLTKKGFIKKNPNRAKNDSRKFLTAELQLWTHFGIKKKNNGKHFFPNEGFIFNIEKIKKIEKSYYDSYGKLEILQSDLFSNVIQ